MSVTVNPNQKGSSITGGLISDEVFASSDSILDKKAGGGAQQYYTPEPAAKLIASVLDSRAVVFDPTAGDGSLLRFFEGDSRFGVELDPDQVENAVKAERAYKSVRGDFQHIYTLFAGAGVTFPNIVANPPFGLKWSEPSIEDGRTINSTLLTLIAIDRLLDESGQFVFIAGKGRFDKIVDRPEAAGIYAVIDVEDLFPGTAIPCVIAFGGHRELRKQWGRYGNFPEGFERREMPVNNLDLLESWIEGLRDKTFGGYRFRVHIYGKANELATTFRGVQTEYDKRTKERLPGEGRKFDVEMMGGERLNLNLPTYTTMVLQKHDRLDAVRKLQGASVNYFIQAEREWRLLRDLERDGLISIEPRVVTAVDLALADTRKVLCPLYPVSVVQRLGFLSDIDTLLCIKSDPERGFHKGTRYDLSTSTTTITDRESRTEQVKYGPKAGEWQDREYEFTREALAIQVGHQRLTDSKKDAEEIQWLVDHFEMPDPGDVSTRYPEETERMRTVLRKIEEEVIHPNSVVWHESHPNQKPVRFRKFQVEDLARLCVKGDGMIAWDPGLGKTLGGIGYALAQIAQGVKEEVLIICPKDLIPQWQRECERFTGKTMQVIRTHGEAKSVRQHLQRGGTGWYITYPEALAVSGTRRNKPLPPVVVKEVEQTKQVPGTGKYGYYVRDPFSGEITPRTYDEWYTATFDESGEYREEPLEQIYRGRIPIKYVTTMKQITSRDICPKCESDKRNGWNGSICEAELPDGSTCGYAHFAVKVKPMGSILSVAFKRGIIINDEATMVGGSSSDEGTSGSKRSLVIRGLRSRRKLGMTGTPIKNYITQAFWPMWWCLGNNTPRFGYGYGDKDNFTRNFAVMQSFKVRGDNKKRDVKALPEVTNLSRFWRMTASSMIRRRKEDTGEPLVPARVFISEVPNGIQQRLLANRWAKKFGAFFKEKNPDAPVVQAGLHEQMAPMLGLNAKLEYAELLPLADVDADWAPSEEDDPNGDFQEVEASNWTPAVLKALELTMALVKEGRKVLIGSPLLAPPAFLVDQLQQKGIDAGHVLDKTGQTLNPDKRATVVHRFQEEPQVMVMGAGIPAIRFGHNLDAASAVVMIGVPWDYESFRQFCDRVHRLTSTRDVRIHIIIPSGEGLTKRKWDLLQRKGQSSQLALDGKIVKEERLDVDKAEVLRELQTRGIPITGDEIDECDVEKMWGKFPTIDAYEPPEGLLADIEEGLELGTLVEEASVTGALEVEDEDEDDSLPEVDKAFDELDTARAIAELEAEELEPGVEEELIATLPDPEFEPEPEICDACGRAEDEEPMLVCPLCNPEVVEPEPEPSAETPVVYTPEAEIPLPAVEPIELPEGTDPALAALLQGMQQQMAALAAKNAELEKKVAAKQKVAAVADESSTPTQLALV